MITYFYHTDEQRDLCWEFLELMEEFPDVDFFQPNREKAPWHVQAILEAEPEPIELNFWPHKLKGQRRPLKAVEGADAIRDLIQEAIIDAITPDDFEVFE